MDGLIIVNKPKGCTSHDIVKKVKNIFNEKVGHTGTLDPMATGVLPLLIGKGTLAAKYLVNHDKKYQVELQLGIKTQTADSEGEIIEKKEIEEKLLDNENIEKVLKTFLGKQEQKPPIYSAIKINGKKLYEYARKGQSVEIPSRIIEIYDIKLLNIDKKQKKIEFYVHCSKGTYIRSLCEYIAEKLGTVGYMSELKRLQVGTLNIKNAITLEELENNKKTGFITLENIFKDKKIINLTDRKLELFLNGVKLNCNTYDEVYRIYNNQKFIGIGVVKNKLLKRDIIL